MARTSTTITQQEIAAIQAFIAANGLIDDEKNGEVLGDFIINRMQADITEATLKAALPYVRQQLRFKSAAQIELEQLVGQFTTKQLDAAYNWFRNQKLLVIEGEEGVRNILAILKEVSPARDFTSQRIEEAIGRLSYSGRGQLYYKEAAGPSTPPATRAGKVNHAATDTTTHKPGVLFTDKPNADGSRFVGGRLNHASVQQEKKPEVTLAQTKDAWQTICEGLTRNGTHGHQARLRKILDSAIAEGQATERHILSFKLNFEQCSEDNTMVIGVIKPRLVQASGTSLLGGLSHGRCACSRCAMEFGPLLPVGSSFVRNLQK